MANDTLQTQSKVQEATQKPAQALITRLPYDMAYDAKPILEMVKRVDLRGLICVSMPVHVENPSNGFRLICELQDAGLVVICCAAWHRDRHIVCTKSRRLTNTWEPIAIFSRSKNYHINREAATKIKKGFEGRESAFDEDEFQTCIGDHWPIRNDRRDRRFLPMGVVLNCGQLADLQPGDRVLDPFGNPGIRDGCGVLGWTYVDGGLTSAARNAKNSKKIGQLKHLETEESGKGLLIEGAGGDHENENLSRQPRDEDEDIERHSGIV